MPRPNGPRAIYSEVGLARRIAFERLGQKPPWSYEGLAKRMTDAGCAINASAIYKIEKSDPPRRITVDELVAFSAVFDVPIEDLLVPPGDLFVAEANRLAQELFAAQREAATADVRVKAAMAACAAFDEAVFGPMVDFVVQDGSAVKVRAKHANRFVGHVVGDPVLPTSSTTMKDVDG